MDKRQELSEKIDEIRELIHSFNWKYELNPATKNALKQVKHFLFVADYHIYDRPDQVEPFDTGFKIGEEIVCKEDNSENVYLGESGIVLWGNHDLTIGKTYIIEDFIFKQVPKNDRNTWTPEEYESVKLYWVQVWIKGLNNPQWLHQFKKRNTCSL